MEQLSREVREDRKKDIAEEILKVVNIKDKNYNSAFEKDIDMFGGTAYCIQLNHKLSRALSLIKASERGEEIDDQGEALKDTLADIVGYTINYIEIITRE